jgi:hypothetical protein
MDTEEKAIYGYDLDPVLRELLTAPVPTDAIA